ncbi:hypothetical protein [Halobacillus campisalis]|uniref:Uncharacterized protein n=1 Tax=Halobacillus campisalis TaxID=435909 RepID=A0ABW2K8K7_9BACI|nr:hypothetical protein [Halobacillus campisalis]
MEDQSTSKALKSKLSFNQMIEHLERKNVRFDLITKNDAKKILQTSNYFYKITAYRKNFEKNRYNQYINLDFKFWKSTTSLVD